MWSFCQKPSRILFRRVAVNETPRGFTFAACPLGANVEVLPGGIVSPDGLLGLSFIILQIDRYQSQTGFSLGLIFGCWFAYPWRSKCSESFGYQPAQEVMAAMSLTNQWVCHGVNSPVSCVFSWSQFAIFTSQAIKEIQMFIKISIFIAYPRCSMGM